ncbi:DUF2785 domain-containing protein [Neobacillus sp. PS3-40]|uniref:DUF2785 domain-containing protein n=1 Tax=Neobacillus sp. PS3-40 TaxID=3070679 RepID=UPI0027DFF9AB|nr:DUF2785 domain-containing protein [Neobacillus sp. PS3-40]WML46368.1 DUF2785 domain-containing protein [Neobacillus sp. PS3-40]
MLKSELKAIDFDTVLKHDDLNNLIERMLDNIGSIDPELRDTLIFNTYGKLIVEDYLTDNQMEHIIEVCRKNLFLGIEERESDLVFTRSFSALVIGLILQKDRQRPFLPEEIVLKTIEGSIKYLNLEKDVRGYVEGKGWAHSIAHGADLLAEAVRHPSFNNGLFFECLEVIKLCLFKETTTKTPFVDDEEERLIFVLEALIGKGITQNELGNWILEVSDTLQDLKRKEGYSLNFFWKKSNVITFLRGLYFRLLHKGEYSELRKSITDILQQWHNQLYSPSE